MKFISIVNTRLLISRHALFPLFLYMNSQYIACNVILMFPGVKVTLFFRVVKKSEFLSNLGIH